MTFSERMKEVLEQGWAASKDLATKAGAKAQDLGERGILMLEIKHLESQAQALLTRLGSEVYSAFSDYEQETLERENSEVKNILEQLTIIRDAIDKKEFELKNRAK